MGEIFSKYGTPYLVGYPSLELNWVFDECEDNLCLCGVKSKIWVYRMWIVLMSPALMARCHSPIYHCC